MTNGAAIEAEGLRKRFGDIEALAGVDLSVPAGTVLGVLGPNGAGKTTAVRILATILRPDAGRATVLGVDVVNEPAVVRSLIGLTGQFAAVDENLTARENLRLVGKLTHIPKADILPRADELLRQFDLADDGDRPVRTFSGGMRRRLDLAAALVHRPPVLFLDEPTTGLDPRSRTDLWQVIGNLVREGTSLLLTTQYLEEADRLADRIVVIDHGRVIAEGTAPDLKARFGSTIVGVSFADAQTARRAAAALAVVGACGVDGDGRTVSVTVDDGARVIAEVVRTLDRERISAEGFAIREPTLDDVFLSLTGRATDAEAAAPGPERSRRGARRRAADRGAA